MVLNIQESGLKVYAMVMEFLLPKLEKNIEDNGKMMSVTAKVSGLNRMGQ
jgi:hypothetical protein